MPPPSSSTPPHLLLILFSSEVIHSAPPFYLITFAFSHSPFLLFDALIDSCKFHIELFNGLLHFCAIPAVFALRVCLLGPRVAHHHAYIGHESPRIWFPQVECVTFPLGLVVSTIS